MDFKPKRIYSEDELGVRKYRAQQFRKRKLTNDELKQVLNTLPVLRRAIEILTFARADLVDAGMDPEDVNYLIFNRLEGTRSAVQYREIIKREERKKHGG